MKRVEKVSKTLNILYPDPIPMPLHHSNTWEMLVAVMLSAQCTDVMVNKVTQTLFAKYQRVGDYAEASLSELEQDIHSTGFFRNKAKNIKATAQILVEEYDGTVPDTLEALTALPGVGRKTAHVVLGYAFGKVEGIIVDTHIKRLSIKFGLTSSNSPENIERDLMNIVPREEWWGFANKLKTYGQEYSPAHKVKDASDPISVALAES